MQKAPNVTTLHPHVTNTQLEYEIRYPSEISRYSREESLFLILNAKISRNDEESRVKILRH